MHCLVGSKYKQASSGGKCAGMCAQTPLCWPISGLSRPGWGLISNLSDHHGARELKSVNRGLELGPPYDERLRICCGIEENNRSPRLVGRQPATVNMSQRGQFWPNGDAFIVCIAILVNWDILCVIYFTRIRRAVFFYNI